MFRGSTQREEDIVVVAWVWREGGRVGVEVTSGAEGGWQEEEEEEQLWTQLLLMDQEDPPRSCLLHRGEKTIWRRGRIQLITATVIWPLSSGR